MLDARSTACDRTLQLLSGSPAGLICRCRLRHLIVPRGQRHYSVGR